LNAVGGVSYGYDSNGNTTSEGLRIYTYNQNQRMIQAVNGTIKANYTYNGNGQRIKKVVNGATTIFHYTLNGQLIAESNSAGYITAEYVYLNGQPLAKMEGVNTYYYHNDHLATPQKITDSSGQIIWSAEYKPFGEATVTVSIITNNMRFPGQYFDAETGLHYNYFRNYSPIIGKYIEADRIGLFGGINLYNYVRQNSIRLKDRFGLWEDAGHTDLTQTGLQTFGNAFNAGDIATIVSANLNVDRLANQFNDAAHYMPGTRDAADTLINNLLWTAIQQQQAGNHVAAMKSLGQCLHTAQDRFPHFEQNAGWREHLPGGTDPDNPTRHPNEYARARNSTEGIVSIFLFEINR
jgi:RHS repeat-associated protein